MRLLSVWAVVAVLVVTGCGDGGGGSGGGGSGGGSGGAGGAGPDDEQEPLIVCDGMGGDVDDDDWCGVEDNCPNKPNVDQTDSDGDGIGDACDEEECDGEDNDGDGLVDEDWNDADADGTADCVDVCPGSPDTDTDFDGTPDCLDICPLDPHDDADEDGICGDVDNCPAVFNPAQTDRDGNSIGDVCAVEECDGVNNDADGLVDEGLPDEDEDGICDEIDPCPGDILNDPDEDGLCGAVDNCPGVANLGQVDSDDDGWGDACDFDAPVHCGPVATLNDPGAVPVPATLSIGDVLATEGEDTIYVSLSSSSPSFPNSIIAIDGQSQSVLWSTWVGSEPQALALADDSSYLYVDLDGAAQVRVIDVRTRRACRSFGLGAGSYGPLFAGDMEVLPGAPETLVVSTRRKGVSPAFGGVFVYDYGQRRPRSTRDHTGAEIIVLESETRAWGTSRGDVYELRIADSGIEEVEVFRDLIGGFDLLYEQGRLYATHGGVADVSDTSLAGTFQTVGAVAVDATSREAFFLADGWTISVFDIDTFLWKRDITLSTSLDLKLFGLQKLQRWGEQGLVAADESNLVIIQHAFDESR